MADSSELDDDARAELLCYLVVGQLVARARTGSWLRTDQSVELLNIWFKGSRTEVDWLEGVRLGALSERIALHFAAHPNFSDSASLAELFTDSWRMDFRSPSIWSIHATCKDEFKEG